MDLHMVNRGIDVRTVNAILLKIERNSQKTLRKKAIILYLEGVGFLAIGRILQISQQIVSYWIKKYGKLVQELRNKENVKYDLVEVDEMYTFLKTKEIRSGYGLFITEEQTRLLILK